MKNPEQTTHKNFKLNEKIKEQKNTINSVFEVKNITKEGFELYNLVNEKNYKVKPLLKIVNYRKIFRGNYLICGIMPFEGEYFLFTINKIINTSQSLTAYQEAVSMQLKSPSLLYQDNKDKLKEIENNIKFLAAKFDEFFENKEIITVNTKLDKLLDAFNEYTEEGTLQHNIQEFIELPQNYSYFDINKNTDSSKIYDVGILFDPDNGLQTIPFWGTFNKIFEVEDYKLIKGYKNCIVEFFKSDKISPFVLTKAYERFGERFLKIAAENLAIKKKIDFNGLRRKYKKNFSEKKNFSSTTILYSSGAFEKLMEFSTKTEPVNSNKDSKISRNAPCPCGSNKKYKKCCL